MVLPRVLVASAVMVASCGDGALAGPPIDGGPDQPAAESGGGNGGTGGAADVGGARGADAGDRIDPTAIDASAPTDGPASDVASPPDKGSLYGIPWAVDSLTNREIGYSHFDAPKPGRIVSIRFLADKTAAFDSWKQFFIFADYTQRTYCQQPPFSASNPNGCYGANSGGTIKMELKGDDSTASHLPTGSALATASITDPKNATPGAPVWGANSSGSFRVIMNSMWSAHPTLERGKLYHMVFTSTYAGPDPWWDYDYICVDNLSAPTKTGRQPGAGDTDLAVLYQDPGKAWVEEGADPSFQVSYADGSHQGLGYIDTRVSTPKPIAGTSQARETFTVSGGDRVLSSVSVRVAKTSTSPNGPLTLQLETLAHVLLDSCTIAASSVGTAHTWISCALSARPTIENGKTYNLLLTAPSGAGSYLIYPLQKGIGYGFDSATFFGDGHADYSTDGGSTWPATIADWGGASAFDYQLFFKPL